MKQFVPISVDTKFLLYVGRAQQMNHHQYQLLSSRGYIDLITMHKNAYGSLDQLKLLKNKL